MILYDVTQVTEGSELTVRLDDGGSLIIKVAVVSQAGVVYGSSLVFRAAIMSPFSIDVDTTTQHALDYKVGDTPIMVLVDREFERFDLDVITENLTSYTVSDDRQITIADITPRSITNSRNLMQGNFIRFNYTVTSRFLPQLPISRTVNKVYHGIIRERTDGTSFIVETLDPVEIDINNDDTGLWQRRLQYYKLPALYRLQHPELQLPRRYNTLLSDIGVSQARLATARTNTLVMDIHSQTAPLGAIGTSGATGAFTITIYSVSNGRSPDDVNVDLAGELTRVTNLVVY